MSWLRSLLIRVLRIPAEPEPPPGAPGSLRVFRASPRFFDYSMVGWLLKQVGAFVGLLFSFATLGIISLGDLEEMVPLEGLGSIERSLVIFAALLFLVQLPVSFVMLRFGYEMRWYMVSDRAVRIREGLFRVREQTMTVANIQNMAIRRGPLQRLFGIADLELQTAGGGGSQGKEDNQSSGSLHRGLLRGLHDAEEVRDLIRAALTRHRDSGLGDPDERVPRRPAARDTAATGGVGPAPGGLLAAAEGVLEEARALRRVVESS